MLTQGELNELLTVVTPRLDEARLGVHVIASRQRIDAITPPAVWPVVASRVLSHANDNSWLPDLMDAFEAEPLTAPQILDACRRCREQWARSLRAAEPLAPAGRRERALVLFNKAPFIDRAPARPLVDEAVRLVGRRVLVVRGREAVGKSYIGNFVRHLVNGMPGAKMALVCLDELDAERVQPRDLMEALATSMGLQPDPGWDQMAQDARQADKLARWLVGKLNAAAGTGPRWVIVIDEIDHPKVAPGAIDLVNRLLRAAARGELVDTSLVAIALPGEVPPGVAADVMEQELAPLTNAEVRSHIADLALALGVALAPDELDALAAFALEGLQFPLDRGAMDTVRDRIGKLPEQILQASA